MSVNYLMKNKFYTLIKSCLLSAALSFSLAQAADNTLPDIGTAALSTLSVDKERLLGDVFMRQTRATLPVDYDPLANEYVNALGNKLVAHAEDVSFPFTFFVVNDPSINAFAFFGGHIGINAGLIALAENESELASVVGHEIAHVTQRHLSRRIESQRLNSPITLAGVLSGILLAVVNPEAGMAAMMATQAGSAQASINYTRSNEQEADRLGLSILVNAGYNPMGAPDFFDKMAARFRHLSTPPAFLLTHPMPESRVADARLRAQQYAKGRMFRDSDEFHFFQSRIIARNQLKSKDAVSFFQNQIKFNRYKVKEAAEYGLAIAYTDTDQLDKAEQIIRRLLKQDNNNLYFIDTLSDILNKRKAWDKALTMLEAQYRLRPNNQVVTLNYANIAVEADQPELAIRLLKYYLLHNPNHFLAIDLLGQAYKKQKDLGHYHEMKAQGLALRLGYQQAIEEINTSLNHFDADKDILAIRRLEARKKQYRSRLKQLKQL